MSHANAMPRAHLLSGWAFPAGALKPLAHALEPAMPVTTADAVPPEPHLSSRHILGGWSLGALLALAAVAAGAKPRALILLAGAARFTASPGYPDGVPAPRLRALARALAREPDQALSGFFALCAAPHAHPVEAVDVQLAAARRIGVPALQHGLHLLAELDLRDVCAQVTRPTLLLHGARDEVIPPGAARWLHERLPTSQLIVHPGAGHDLPLRQPGWCAARILHFIETCT